MMEEKRRCVLEEGSDALVMAPLIIYLKSWELRHAC